MSQQLDDIVGRMRASIRSGAALMEGSFTMDNLRAVGQEFLLCYLALERLEDNWSIDSAKGGFLDRKALDYGIDRKGADYGRGLVRFTGAVGVVIPYGTVAVDLLGVTYKVMAKVAIGAGGTVDVLCEAQVIGVMGNAPAEGITRLVEPIQGVTGCLNLEAFTGGRGEESDFELRSRVYEKIRNPITSGNVNSYRQWALGFDDVGAVKVFALWNGPGTVKVSVLDAQRKPATSELLQEVQRYIDPGGGDGSGQAPVGAIVTVATAAVVGVDVAAKVQIGASASIERVQEQLKVVLDEFFYNIAYDDVTQEFTVARCGYLLLGIDGVFDYVDLTLNGGSGAVSIGDEQVLQVGSVLLTAR